MPSVSRTALFGKIHKVLKKYYKPVAPPPERTVLEHLLFACVLEDARYESAEEAFAALKHTFYDWNEVRVTSISELSEVMAALPDPRAAANRIKRVLHSVFEELYCFDLEDKRKKNLGPTVKWLEKVDGTSKFVVAYVIQAALSGHSIPIDAGTMAALKVLDLVSDKEVAAGEVLGLERAVSKSKGVEFGSLVHQLGVDYLSNPFSPQVREILLAIDPEAAGRFPQRRQPRAGSAAGRGSCAHRFWRTASPYRRTQKEDGNGAPATPAAVESKAAEAEMAESKAAEPKPPESKKAVAAATEKPAESTAEPPVPEKQHDKPPERKSRKGREATPRRRSSPRKSKNRKNAWRRRPRPCRLRIASASASLDRSDVP